LTNKSDTSKVAAGNVEDRTGQKKEEREREKRRMRLELAKTLRDSPRKRRRRENTLGFYIRSTAALAPVFLDAYMPHGYPHYNVINGRIA